MVRSTALTLAWALVCLAHPAWAVDRTAASCSSTDVQATIDASADGDRVIIPAGNCTWATRVETRQKFIKIIGGSANPVLPAQGSDGTVTINTDNTTGTLASFFLVYESTVGHVEVANLTFVLGPTATKPSAASVYMAHVVGGKATSVHHNTFRWPGHNEPLNAIWLTYNRGVVWRNKFLSDVPLAPQGWLSANGSFQLGPSVTDGELLYNAPSTLGADDTTGYNNAYFETNYVENQTNQAIDTGDGVRIVVRYNTFVDSAIGFHGHDSSPIGIRQFEIYNNTFVFTDRGLDNANIGRWIGTRGGTGVVTDNIIPNNVGSGQTAKFIPSFTMTLFALYTDQCYRGTYPFLRQIGWGWSGTQVDVHGDPQVLEPIYVWNNRVAVGVALSQGAVTNTLTNSCGTPPLPVTAFLLGNREYFNDTGAPNGKPGYVKFQYPHPLTLSRSASPSAPSNLQVR